MTEASLSPEAELNTAREARMAGTMNDRDFYAAMERLGPLVGSGTNAPAPGANDTQKQVDALKQQRMEGKIRQPEFLKEMERLHPQTEATASAAPNEFFPPVKGPWEYNLPSTLAPEEDTAVRTALMDAGVPLEWGETIFNAVESSSRFAEEATPEVREARGRDVGERLRTQWGADYQPRVDAIERHLEAVATKHPAFAPLMRNLFYSEPAMNQLVQIVQHRGGGK